MKRRLFLSSLGATVAAGNVYDPERLLWRPGRQLISIPAATDAVETITSPCGPTLTIRSMRERVEAMDFDERFTVAGIYSTNPITGMRVICRDPATGRRFQFLQQFTALGRDSANGRQFPAIIESGPYRNCDIDWSKA